MTMENDESRALRRTIAKCVLRGHQLRNEMDELAKSIGHNVNIVDLNISTSAMAETEKNHQLNKWESLIEQFRLNENEKINARMELLRVNLKNQMA